MTNQGVIQSLIAIVFYSLLNSPASLKQEIMEKNAHIDYDLKDMKGTATWKTGTFGGLEVRVSASPGKGNSLEIDYVDKSNRNYPLLP
jgi:hypothetical protein